MKHKYTIGLFGQGTAEFAKGIREYAKWLETKTDEMARRLAVYGYDISFNIIADHIFNGETIGSLKFTHIGNGQYIVSARSEAILFLEFGAGLNGGGHPLAGEHGMGPGTYPGQTHAFDPNGWWFPTTDNRLIVSETEDENGNVTYWGHSYGNKAYAPMYTAVKTLEQEFEQIVREVFSS